MFKSNVLILACFLLLLFFTSYSFSISEVDKKRIEYFSSLTLDYGDKTLVRKAGWMAGFLRSGSILSLKEKDPYFRWLNEYLELGPQPIKGRLKPFYAIDFGTRRDLAPHENPKIIIVGRKLSCHSNSTYFCNPPSEIDYEIRNVWQPWLKPRCDFAIRYIIPNRKNIIRIMESRGLHRAEVEVKNDSKGHPTLIGRQIFRPVWWKKWFLGQKDVIAERNLGRNVLRDSTALSLIRKDS